MQGIIHDEVCMHRKIMHDAGAKNLRWGLPPQSGLSCLYHGHLRINKNIRVSINILG